MILSILLNFPYHAVMGPGLSTTIFWYYIAIKYSVIQDTTWINNNARDHEEHNCSNHILHLVLEYKIFPNVLNVKVW